MQLTLTEEQAIQLRKLADQEGKPANELAREVFSRGLAEEAHYLEAVRAGREAVRRADFVEKTAVWADIEAILQS